MTDDARHLLEEYVGQGKLMQLASVAESGHPALCHVWYKASFRPDRMYFISRIDRSHSANIRSSGYVAGGVVTIPLAGLGQQVRGVTFTGNAVELGGDAKNAIDEFIGRWPEAAKAITVEKITNNKTQSRLYEVRVTEWVLFDEKNFSDNPRRVVPAIHEG